MNADEFRNGQTVALLLDVAAFDAALSETDRPNRYSNILTTVASKRRLRRATAYVALDLPSSAQSELLSNVRDSGFRIMGKPLRPLSDGSMRGYLGVEMAVDAVLAAETCDIVTVITGDADFLPAVRAAQSKGARVEVIGCPGQNLDSLRDASDSFTPIGSIFDSTKSGDHGKRGARRPPARAARLKRNEWPTPPPPPPEPSARRSRERRPPAPRTPRILEGERLSGITTTKPDESRSG